MELAPLLPLPWIVLLVSGAMLAEWRWMGGRGLWLRTAVVVALGLLLANPAARKAGSGQEQEESASEVWLVADDSTSMGTMDAGENESRWSRVIKGFAVVNGKRWLVGENVRSWESRRAEALRPGGGRSELIEGMRELVGLAKADTVMMLASDGRDTTVRGGQTAAWMEVAEMAVGKGVRIDGWMVGTVDEGREKLRARLAGSPTRAFVGERVVMTAVVERGGKRLDAGAVIVRLMRDGKLVEEAEQRWEAEQRVISVSFSDVPFSVGTQNAWAEYEVSVGEVSSQAMLVCNRGKAVRVLMLVGEPGVESRMMLDALRRDERVRLTVEQAITDERVSVTRYHEAEHSDGGRVRSLEQLMGFDVVVAGQGADTLIEKRWLEAFAMASRGSLVGIVRGDWAGVMADGTGRRWAEYRAEVMARILSSADGSAARGVVDVWTEPVNAEVGQTVRVFVKSWAGAADENGRVRVRNREGGERAVVMARDAQDVMRMSGEFSAAEAGLVRIEYAGSDGKSETAVMVREGDVERRDVSAWPDGMRALVEGTGGRMLDGMQGWKTGASMKDDAKNEASKGKLEPMLLRWEVMTVIVVMLGGAWVIRRWSGAR